MAPSHQALLFKRAFIPLLIMCLSDELFGWLRAGPKRERVLRCVRQPMTAAQLSRVNGLERPSCESALAELRKQGFVRCVNGEASRCRLYWLTRRGRRAQDLLLADDGQRPPFCVLPEVDWELYGWVCHAHRSTVLKAVSGSVGPAEIRKRAVYLAPEARVSTNNTRDVIRLFRDRGIIRRVSDGPWPKYELTELGRHLQELLFRAETRME